MLQQTREKIEKLRALVANDPDRIITNTQLAKMIGVFPYQLYINLEYRKIIKPEDPQMKQEKWKKIIEMRKQGVPPIKISQVTNLSLCYLYKVFKKEKMLNNMKKSKKIKK